VFISNSESTQILMSTSEWREVKVTAVAPAGAGRAKVFWRGFTIGANGKTLYLDNFKLNNLTSISGAHYCLDSINLAYDSDLLVNKATVTDPVTLAETVATNTASVTANGEHSATYTVDFDPAGASTYSQWVTRVVNSAALKQIQGVTVPVVRDDGKAGDIADQEIGNTMQIEFAQDPLPALQTVSIISRINHVITPDLWIMNIGLWRGI
jgi:hypothetical protein